LIQSFHGMAHIAARRHSDLATMGLCVTLQVKKAA
jgi:hypothetical protein